MGLKSGIIVPFQFKNNKKLLMIGIPMDERDLTLPDFKTAVWAAFGVYEFEFRNIKIDFPIPDQLFVQYLEQKGNLTNFVVEIFELKSQSQQNIAYDLEQRQTLSTPVKSLTPDLTDQRRISETVDDEQLTHIKFEECEDENMIEFGNTKILSTSISSEEDSEPVSNKRKRNDANAPTQSLKLYHSLNISYPKKQHQNWLLIQRKVFDFVTDLDHMTAVTSKLLADGFENSTAEGVYR